MFAKKRKSSLNCLLCMHVPRSMSMKLLNSAESKKNIDEY